MRIAYLLTQLIAVVYYGSKYSRVILLKLTSKLTVKRYDNSEVSQAYKLNLDQELISVIFPTKNGLTNGVENLIESLQKQTLRPFEIIAVDSGSTDGTQEYLASRGVIVLDNSLNEFHHARSRNIGAERAVGKYFLFTVDDASFNDVTWIERALKLLVHSNSDSLSGVQKTQRTGDFYSIIKTQSQITAASRYYKDFCVVRLPVPLRHLYRALGINSPLAPVDDTNHLVRREAFDKLKFRTNTVEDLEFGTRLLKNGGKVFYTRYLSIVHGHVYCTNRESFYATRIAIDQKVFREEFQYGPFNTYRLHQLYHAFKEIMVVHERLKSSTSKTKFRSEEGLFHYLLRQIELSRRSQFIIDELNADRFIEQVLGRNFVNYGKLSLDLVDRVRVEVLTRNFYRTLAHSYASVSGVSGVKDLFSNEYRRSAYETPPDIQQFSNMYKYLATNYVVTLASFSNVYLKTRLKELTFGDWS